MVLGIDLGTSNTVASTVSRDGTPVIIPDVNDKNQFSTSTIVLLDGVKGYVGEIATNLSDVTSNKELFAFFKRYFGSGIPVYTDEQGNQWHSEGLAALILKKIIHDAEIYLPDGFTKTVITVPAHYNDIQRRSVLEAARLAGMEIPAIIDEPVAAALYYGQSQGIYSIDELTLVYDFGGGTFDLTLITQSEDHLHVIAKDGIEKLGGKEFDEIVSAFIKESYQAAFSKPFPEDNKHYKNQLQKISEEIKLKINASESSVLKEFILIGKDAFECIINTEIYREKAKKLIDQTSAVVNRCLRTMGLGIGEIQKIILIGGTSSSKIVYDYWLEKTAGTNVQVIYHQPLNSVAKGAALYAYSLHANGSSGSSLGINKSIELKTVSTYNLCLITSLDSKPDLLIHRNTPLPVSANRLYKLTGELAQNFSIEVCQFWEESEKQTLGNIRLDASVGTMGSFTLELILENKANGTIGLKLGNADTGKEIPFTFTPKESNNKYESLAQRKLVDSIYINNIF